MDPQEHFARHGQAEGRSPHPNHAVQLESRLWGGFSQLALPELIELCEHPSSREADYAAWALARWHAAHKQWHEAERRLRQITASQPFSPPFVDYTVLRVDVLTHLGRSEEAREILNKAIAAHGPAPDLCLVAAHIDLAPPDQAPPDHPKLYWLNSLYTNAGLAPLVPAATALPLSLDNLAAPVSSPCTVQHQPLISALVPARNAEQTIESALRGLLAQTWQNLEILVINDGSTDQTAERTADLARQDSRIRLVELERSYGAYGARNAGLLEATGELITTHDSDDWSHPQRLEILARELLTHPELKGVLGHWVRIGTDLCLHRWPMRERYLHAAVATLLFRREVVQRLGRWDNVRAGADSEYLQRMRTVFGKDCVRFVLPDVPLTLARQSALSLTNAPETHLRTEMYGYRQVYRELYTHWHATDAAHDFFLDPKTLQRPFSVPSCMDSRIPAPHFDTILVGDMGQGAAGQEFRQKLLYRLLAFGHRIALWHRPAYNNPTSLAPWALDLICTGKASLVLPGERLSADRLLITESYVLSQPQDNPPTIRFQRARFLACEDIDRRPELVDEYPVYLGTQSLHSDRPTILVCGHAAGTELFGAERSLLDLLHGFQSLGFNVLVALPLTTNRPYLESLQASSHLVCTLPLRHWSAESKPSDRIIRRLCGIIRYYQIDAVHSNTIMLREPLLAARQCGIPGVIHAREALFHDNDLCRTIGLPAAEIRHQVLQVADHIIANSAFIARSYETPYNTYVVPNTVDLEALNIDNPVQPDRIEIGLISSNIPKKGIHEMVELARRLGMQAPQARFRMIGPINEHIIQIRKDLDKAPSIANISFPGYAASPLEALRQVNIVLNLSSVEESFGRTVLEAMAARRPVLVYNWGALPELVEEGINGFIVPYRDLEAMVEKLAWLCTHPEAIKRMGEAGRIKAVECFRQYKFLKFLRQGYARILPSHHGSARKCEVGISTNQ
jgi:glycosyltransferase involved in cell wall biosynthesis